MSSRGIYTLANDTIYDQLVALLNSIEKNISPEIPVFVIPYDDRLDLVTKEISSRSNVNLFDDDEALAKWDNFFNEVWPCHSKAKERLDRPHWYKGFVHRKFASFDGPLDKFVFFDGDSLAMKPVDDIFEKLDTYDLVFDDWEHTKNKLVTQLDLDAIEATTKLNEEQIHPRIHCDSFFGGNRGMFSAKELEMLKNILIEKKEIQWVKDKCWWSCSAMFNTLTLHTDYTLFNFTLSPNHRERTGNCADSDDFVDIDGVLYNTEGLKPIHRIHYMNYSSVGFTRLCQGEDADIRYKDTFLKYRFLKNPEAQPKYLKKPNLLIISSRRVKKVLKKIERFIS